MPNRSTGGVCRTPCGKCPPTPIGATKPGPKVLAIGCDESNGLLFVGSVGSGTVGFDSTSRCVTVDWLRLRIVREVSGASPLAKNAAVRALATAPSMAKTSPASSPAKLATTSSSVRTPRMRPLRSTMVMIASSLAEAAAARARSSSTSPSVSTEMLPSAGL
jgi:hypothetical protein